MTEATDAGGTQRDRTPTAGEQLREARKARNLTIQQVAQALHLDPWILEALEENRFKDVGAPVFVKGHLRKYAVEVGLEEQAIMEAYYRAEDTPEMPRLVTDTFSRPVGSQRARLPVILVSVVLALLILVVLAMWLRKGGFGLQFDSSHSETPPVSVGELSRVDAEPVPIPAARPTAASATEAADLSVSDIAITQSVEQSPGTRSIDPQPAVDDEPVAVPLPADDGRRLVSIEFRNDSWVEIYDAGNRRLFFDLARAGTTRSVSGEPPLQVLLGDSEGARVRVDGEVWPIPAEARRGKTARFTVR